MKGVQIGEKERIEIDTQVDKVLRGLGNPEPPVSLDTVRELLRLDRQYYSSTDDSALREFISKVKIGAQQLFLRPTLIFDVVKKASVSAFWIPDGKRILIDRNLPEKKHRWAETHEVIHSITEWHKLFLFGDSTRELNPACHDLLEAEANYGAGQLLFMRGRFAQEARDMEMSLATVKTLSTRFGNTMTSTLWRYVEHFTAGSVTLASKLIDGNFPDYQSGDPDRQRQGDDRPEQDVSRRQAVARVSTIAAEKSRAVKMRPEKGMHVPPNAITRSTAAPSRRSKPRYEAIRWILASTARYLAETSPPSSGGRRSRVQAGRSRRRRR